MTELIFFCMVKEAYDRGVAHGYESASQDHKARYLEAVARAEKAEETEARAVAWNTELKSENEKLEAQLLAERMAWEWNLKNTVRARDEARAACAKKDEALKLANAALRAPYHYDDNLYEKINAALAEDCGKELLEELERLRKEAHDWKSAFEIIEKRWGTTPPQEEKK